MIVDYGSGNLRSVVKAFEHINSGRAITTNNPMELAGASHIILPGVGAFADCKAGLKATPNLIDALIEQVIGNRKPFLGICVGMQLMATLGREHVETPGLGWIQGQIIKTKPNDINLKIPHMGWNELVFNKTTHPVLSGFDNMQHAYFVHSYCFQAADPKHVLACVDYGGPITAIVGKDNLIGTQFHPEKSQRFGLDLIERFLNWDGTQ